MSVTDASTWDKGCCDLLSSVPMQRGKKLVLKSICFLVFIFKFGYISGPEIQRKNLIAWFYHSCSESLVGQCLKNLQTKAPKSFSANILVQGLKSFKSLGHLRSLETPEHLLHAVRQAESPVSTDLVKLPMNLLTPFKEC